jgi:hypothetical protein
MFLLWRWIYGLILPIPTKLMGKIHLLLHCFQKLAFRNYKLQLVEGLILGMNKKDLMHREHVPWILKYRFYLKLQA